MPKIQSAACIIELSSRVRPHNFKRTMLLVFKQVTRNLTFCLEARRNRLKEYEFNPFLCWLEPCIVLLDLHNGLNLWACDMSTPIAWVHRYIGTGIQGYTSPPRAVHYFSVWCSCKHPNS